MTLMACPFCGEDSGIYQPALSDKIENYQQLYYVSCQRCRCKTGDYLKPEFAIERWNTRNLPKSNNFR